MQQQPPSSTKSPALFPPTPASPISTDDVQKYVIELLRKGYEIKKLLEENKRLILAIMENQNLGKIAEATQYRSQLQNNLLYLTAIADTQPQLPTTPSQTPLLSSLQEENRNQQQQPHFMGSPQQSSGWPPNSRFERDQQHLMLLKLQQQQHYQAQTGGLGQLNSNSGGMHQSVQPGFGMFSSPTEVRGNKLDFLEAGFGSGGQKNSASGHGGVGDRDSHF